MYRQIWRWLTREREERSPQAFFEETLDACFKQCISSVSSPLSPKESKCITECTRQRVENVKKIEQAMEKQFLN